MLSICIACMVTISAMAYTEETYYEAGVTFMTQQYYNEGIDADIDVYTVLPLLDENDDIIAKMMVFDRDGEYDYVVLNFIVDYIDEYGFSQQDFVSYLLSYDNVYYAGNMNFVVESDGIYYDSYGNIADKSTFDSDIVIYKSYVSSLYSSDSSVNEIDIYENFYYWYDVPAYNITYDYSASNYITGITSTGVANGLDFQNQTDLNNDYNDTNGTAISGTCTSVALTNLCIYYDYVGELNNYSAVNILMNNSVYQTFNHFIYALSADGTYSASHSDGVWAFVDYLQLQSYSYSYNYLGYFADWDDIVDTIDDNDPILAAIGYYKAPDDTGNNTGGHAILIVGYSEYEYYGNISIWAAGVPNISIEKYVRVVDGWSTADSGRYIAYDFDVWSIYFMCSSFSL